ncbi:MAG: aminotransferase class IV [Planctomycetota bacterium]|jgi:D-alanine transaminase
MQIAMIDEKIVPFESLGSAYLDRGVFFGDGVYEVLRSYEGEIFAIEEHLSRFAMSLAAVEITGVDIDLIRKRITKAFSAANIANAKIYFHITRGSGLRNHLCDEDMKPNFFLTITELPDDSGSKRKGFTVSTYPDLRWKRCDIKSLNLLANVMAKRDAAKKGCDEAILVDESGLITEGASSAFFAVFAGTLQTTELGKNILPSITRKYIMKVATSIDMTVKEESMTPQQAASADELFIAVSTKDIVPVVKFDGQIIGDGCLGTYTKMLQKEFLKTIG